MEIKRYSVGQFAEAIGRSVRTVQRWDKQGILVAKRTLTGRRYYTDTDIKQVLEKEGIAL